MYNLNISFYRYLNYFFSEDYCLYHIDDFDILNDFFLDKSDFGYFYFFKNSTNFFDFFYYKNSIINNANYYLLNNSIDYDYIDFKLYAYYVDYPFLFYFLHYTNFVYNFL
jgi:hypothetical protein